MEVLRNDMVRQPQPRIGQGSPAPSRNGPSSWFAILLALIGGLVPGSAAEPASESSLRAVLIYRFTTLAQFPAASFASPEAPIRIVVLGNDPVFEPLRKLVADKKLAGRPIEVSTTTSPDVAAEGLVVYVAPSAAASTDALLRQTQEKPVLSIGSVGAFCAKGGMIAIFRKEQKLDYDINADAVQRAAQKGLQLNPIVFKVGKTVRD